MISGKSCIGSIEAKGDVQAQQGAYPGPRYEQSYCRVHRIRRSLASAKNYSASPCCLSIPRPRWINSGAARRAHVWISKLTNRVFQGGHNKPVRGALLSAEILASFDVMRGRDPPARHCAELWKAGAYGSESECRKEMGAYKAPSNYSGETLATVTQLHKQVLHLGFLRLKQAAQHRMRNAEALTAE
jgi:hypothetical protein